MEPARRHRRHLLADARPAGARRVLRRRGGVTAPLRSHLATLDRPAPGADRAAARLPRRDAGHLARLSARRDRDRARGPRAAGGAARRRALRRAARDPPRALPAPRAAAAPARRRRGAPRLDGGALGGRLPRPVQDPRVRDPRLARRGLHGAPGGGRRAAARAPASDAGRARARGVARGDPLELRGPRRAGGRVLGRIPDPRARPGRALRGGDLRRPAAAAAAAPLPARRGHRLVQRPRPERPGGARAARHRAAITGSARSRPRGTTRTSCSSSTPRAAGSTCRWSGST